MDRAALHDLRFFPFEDFDFDDFFFDFFRDDEFKLVILVTTAFESVSESVSELGLLFPKPGMFGKPGIFGRFGKLGKLGRAGKEKLLRLSITFGTGLRIRTIPFVTAFIISTAILDPPQLLPQPLQHP